jgi:hypothetical protein
MRTLSCCFQNGLFSKHTYHDFGCNCPTTAVELRDMMAQWADQEDEENDRFPKRTSRATVTTTSTRASGTTRGIPKSASQIKKSRLLSAIRGARSRGAIKLSLKKFCTNDARCTRRPSINSSSASASASHSTLHSEKRKDQEDNDEGDKSGAQDFQDPKNVVNIIFGGDDGFPSKRAQKLTLHETVSVEPAIQKPLRYSENSRSS